MHGQGRKLPLTNRSIHRQRHQPEVRSQQPRTPLGGNRKPSNPPRNNTKIMGMARNTGTLYTVRTIWINITTTDAFNRTTVDTYTFLIDGEVTSTPTLPSSGTQTLGQPDTYLDQITNALDNLVDAGGVGSIMLNVSRIQTTGGYPSYNNITDITPSNCRPNHSIHINCRIKDQVGNYRKRTPTSPVWSTSQTNHQLRSCSNTINDNTTLTITSTDDKSERNINGDHHMDEQRWKCSWNTTVNYNGTWTGVAQRTKRNLTDGTISVSNINAHDWAGNQQTDTINSWTLNTTTATSIFALNYNKSMVKVGNYLSPTVQFIATPTNWRFLHNNHTALHAWPNRKPSSPKTTHKPWGWPIPQGKSHIRTNLDQHHNNGRLQSNDRGHLHLPHRWRSHINTNTVHHRLEQQSWPTRHSLDQTHTGQSGRCRRCRIQSSECFKNGQSSPTIPTTSITDITPSGTAGQTTAFTISCRIKDQVGNIGNNTTISGFVDLQTKRPSTTLLAGKPSRPTQPSQPR